MSFSNYGPLCTEVYALTKPVGAALGGDIQYYLERLKSCKGRILEAMVGSGRVLIPLLEAGLQVDGVDYSPEMLAVCQQSCAERGLSAHLVEADLQSLSLPERYEAILIPGGSFMLMEDRQVSLNVLKRLYEHLQPGGRLLLDYFLPDTNFQLGSLGAPATFSLPDGDIITMEKTLVEADLYLQHKVTYLKYEKWRNGALLQTELQRLAMRWYGVEEFKLILESVGFTDVALSADYQYGQAPTRAGQTYVFEATRS
jgi:SAM-dependent methyltransferase